MWKDKALEEIWQQVPPDYYDKGITRNPLQFIWHNLKFRSFKSLVGKNNYKKILDVGCAGGTMAAKVAKVFPDAEITGIDVYPPMIDYAKRKYPHMKFLVADAHKLPFKPGSFDLVTCYETIEHVLQPDKVLKELKRVLKKDGTAIVAMDSGNLLFRSVWFFWEKTFGRAWQGAHIHPFHHTELEKLIKKEGFKIKKKRFSHSGMEVSFVLKK